VDSSVLAYRVIVRSAWNIETVFVNATTGAIERRETRIHRQQTTDVPKIGAGTGVLNDQKKVSADLFSGTYYAYDIMRPADAVTLDFHGSFNRLNTFMQNGLVTLSDIAVSSNNTWTDGAVVDSHVYQGWVYDFYFKSFGRRSLDDNNLAIIGIVHPLARADASRYSGDIVSDFINNAAYIGDGFMYYGDGDGHLYDYLAGSLDVIAHELTHGVTDFSSQLEYHDEPGALNEAFSDIMGTSAEYFLEKSGQGPQKGPNFVMGEDITRTSPGFVRSLQNPIAGGDPDHYSLRQYIGTEIDNGGVHVNSTIVSHAFYLAVAGGRNRVSGIQVSGIGVGNIDRMAKIFYRGFVFMLGPPSQFADARVATLQAAADLYGAGSNERAQLAQAWSAVGIQ
jgi:thermolysin